VPILSYAQTELELSDDPESLFTVLCGEIGGRLLRNWNMPAQPMAVVTQMENWWRDT